MQLTDITTAPLRSDGGDTRDGVQEAKELLLGKEGASNFKVNLTRAMNDWKAPRHHHDFDQIRLCVSGEFVFAEDRVLPPGCVAYFPEGAYYGPQVRKQDSLILLCQFGGAGGNGYMSRARRKLAVEALRKRGTFEKGSFTYVDESGQRHRQDSNEAIWEEANGRKLVYPQARYDDIVAMNPTNFQWVPQLGSAGVAHKWLGTFTEREIRIGFVRLDPEASIKVGTHPSPEILFLTEGSVECQQRSFPKHSAFSFDGSDGPVAIQAKEPSTLFYIQLPKL